MEATPTWLVCLLGIGIVFVGLVLLVLISSIMSALCRATEGKKPAAQAAAPAAPVQDSIAPEEKGKIVAAVSAAIAEELGSSVSAIRIKSIRRV